jgi:MHS family proline/betaine transporter-like MFS transporter
MAAEYLVRTTGNRYAPAYYMMGAALIGLIAVWMMRETARRPLRGSPPTISETELGDDRPMQT